MWSYLQCKLLFLVSSFSSICLVCNSPPQVGGWYMSIISNLDNKLLKGCGRSALVKKSTICSFDEIGNSLRTLAWSFSRTIWQSISKCLVRSWNTGFAAIWRAVWLSQYMTGVLVHLICKSWRTYRIHWNSYEAAAVL